MNDEVVSVEVTGWEWRCPKCSHLNCMSRSVYSPGFPVQCDLCFESFESDAYPM